MPRRVEPDEREIDVQKPMHEDQKRQESPMVNEWCSEEKPKQIRPRPEHQTHLLWELQEEQE